MIQSLGLIKLAYMHISRKFLCLYEGTTSEETRVPVATDPKSQPLVCYIVYFLRW
jgi:hypothetical protein